MTNPPDFSLFKFKHPMRVRWAEVDAQQVVFNGHYLTYFDVAFTEYLRALDLAYPNGLKQYNCDLYVRKTTIEYHAPARFDDEIIVHVRTLRLGNSSITIQMEITCGQRHLISGTLVYVNVDDQTQVPKRVPQGLREVFTRYDNLPAQANPSSPKLVQVNPVLPVSNMEASIQFYEQKLGFKNVYDSSQYDTGGLNYAVMCRQSICLHLQLFDQLNEQPQIRIQVQQIEALFEEFIANGVFGHQPQLRQTPWGTKEFAFFDPNRISLTFYEDLP